MLLRNTPLSHRVDPRVLVREGIRAWQFIVEFPGDTSFKNLSQTEVLRCFNKAMEKVGSDLEKGERKIKSIMKLPNKGFLGKLFGMGELSNSLAQTMLMSLSQCWKRMALVP
jgi:hypothetical protein